MRPTDDSTQVNRLVVGLGEILWDMLPDGKQLGGAPANFAYHAGQLLGMGKVLAVSAVGEDALAKETVEALRAHGLRTLLPQVPFPTGTVEVTLSGDGIPSYEIKEAVAWDNIPFNEEIKQVAAHCRAVCFGTLAQRSHVSRATIQAFLDATPADCLKIFDINLRQQFYSKSIIEESLQHCNILKINDEELEIVRRMCCPTMGEGSAEQVCRHLLDAYQLDLLILTCGTAGSYVFTSDTLSFLETPKVEVADTVGAGDSFTAAFVASILQGKSISESHQIAVQVSAYVCTQHGAMSDAL